VRCVPVCYLIKNQKNSLNRNTSIIDLSSKANRTLLLIFFFSPLRFLFSSDNRAAIRTRAVDLDTYDATSDNARRDRFSIFKRFKKPFLFISTRSRNTVQSSRGLFQKHPIRVPRTLYIIIILRRTHPCRITTITSSGWIAVVRIRFRPKIGFRFPPKKRPFLRPADWREIKLYTDGVDNKNTYYEMYRRYQQQTLTHNYYTYIVYSFIFPQIFGRYDVL